jgi:hypothetical protein
MEDTRCLLYSLTFNERVYLHLKTGYVVGTCYSVVDTFVIALR